MRNVQYHKRVIECKYFRAYYSGAYALWELDFGRTGYGEFVICLGCVDKLVDWVYNKRIVPKEKPFINDIAY